VVSLKGSLSRLVLVSVVGSFLVLASYQMVQAESYVAGMVGLTIPHSLSSVDIDDPSCPSGCKSTDLKLKESLMYGAKVGHYFESRPALGVELEAFNTTPHLKQQTQTITGPCGLCPVTGTNSSYFRVTTIAFNLVGRLPGEVLQPYGAVGLGLFFAEFHDATGSQSSTAPGLNTQLGLRYMLNHNVALFGEWKFNYARFDFDPTPAGDLGFKSTYMAHHLVFGVGYHF
jgi:opacity protein-like surface antigen